MSKVNVLIGISGGQLARYSVFYDSILHLATPQGTALVQAKGANIAENRNGIAEEALKIGAEWVFYVDDDQVFAPDTLLQLLKHDKDVVSGLYVSREAPFIPHIYDKEDEREWCFPRLLKPFDGGLTGPLKATGAGCLLVRTKVFEKMEKPYWRLGQITKDGWGDDLNFCHRVREAGFEIWADLNVVVGHQFNATLWPKRQPDGTWTTVILQGNQQQIAEFPAAQEKSSLIQVNR